jgi:predicted DNA-binding protein (UPF0278 family)
MNINIISEKRRNEILHILRNPYGHSQEEIRQAQLDSADEIENLIDAYENMKAWAETNGVDTLTYHP